jgi:hypothetical protein
VATAHAAPHPDTIPPGTDSFVSETRRSRRRRGSPPAAQHWHMPKVRTGSPGPHPASSTSGFAPLGARPPLARSGPFGAFSTRCCSAQADESRTGTSPGCRSARNAGRQDVFEPCANAGTGSGRPRSCPGPLAAGVETVRCEGALRRTRASATPARLDHPPRPPDLARTRASWAVASGLRAVIDNVRAQESRS